MWELIKLFIESAKKEKHWPLILLVAIVPAFSFSQLFFELKFRQTFGHWSFWIGCGLICTISGVLDWAIVYRSWRRLLLGGPLSIVGVVLVTMGLWPCSREPLPPDRLVVTVARLTPGSPGAAEDAETITRLLFNGLRDKELYGAPLQAKSSAIQIDIHLDEASQTRRVEQLGRSCESNAHIVLWGEVDKADSQIIVRANLSVTNEWQKEPIEDRGKTIDSTSRQPTNIKIKDQPWVANAIADMVTLVRGLAYFRTQDWGEAIRILNEANSNESYFYKALCYYERAQQAPNRKEDLDAAIETYKKIVVESTNPTAQDIELSYAVSFNLANAYMALGESSSPQDAVANFRRAADAYRTGLQLYAEPQTPQWAVENNLGVALFKLGTQVGVRNDAAIQHLDGAVRAYQDALEVCAREERNRREPHREDLEQNRALTHNNLGSALAKLAELGEGADRNDRFAEAKKQFEAALEFYDREKNSKRWAMAQNNLANTLAEIGNLTPGERGNQALREAVVSYLEVLMVYEREKYPQQYAVAQYNLGYSLCDLRRRVDRVEGNRCLRDAVIAYRAAIDVSCPNRFPQLCGRANRDLRACLAIQ